MSSLSRPVLVLNKGWIPIRIASVKRCLKLVFADRASIVNPTDYFVYDWETWIKIDCSNDKYVIQTSSIKIKVPEVIVLLKYDKVYIKDLRLTKRNIYIRDKYRCQYSGQQINYKDADIDHVIPRSRGGTNSWDNMVVCKKDINRIKADRTPEEAGLKLIRKPTRPSTEHLLIDPKIEMPESWSQFLRKNK
jgi:5-methylcytosine-specific restriction endonuclease McrA